MVLRKGFNVVLAVVGLVFVADVVHRASGTTRKAVAWDRPCTLAGTWAAAQIQREADNGTCASCGADVNATIPKDGCTFKDLNVKLGDIVPIYYLGNDTHNLFLDSNPCAFEEEVCNNTTSAWFNTSNPWHGPFWISDAIDDYCISYNAYLRINLS